MMPLTLRELEWRAVAKQRDEWQRWSRLLHLVDVRTSLFSDAKPRPLMEWWPRELLPEEWIPASADPPAPPDTPPPNKEAYQRLREAVRSRRR